MNVKKKKPKRQLRPVVNDHKWPLEYLNNSAQKTIKNSSDIKALIDNPDKYFSQNQITDIYVKYKNYDFEEWYDKDKLQQATE